MFTIQFAYPYVFYICIPMFIVLLIYRWKMYQVPQYTYSLAAMLKRKKLVHKNHRKYIYFALRTSILFGLIFLIARPQWVDKRSNVNIEGVDIMLTLDVSGSMQLFDDLKDRRQRIDIAKQEALRFIDKRPDDPIGIVIFGAQALSRCPLTLDKGILKDIIREIKLGIINMEGTSLGTGMAIAVNKLRHSQAVSKIIILLTDGQPTPHTEKISVDTAIDLAKEFEIKVYTIGIGNKHGAYAPGFMGQIQQVPDSVDEKLLKKIARETSGKYFRANNSQEMRAIYDTINTLEKTKYETNLFQRRYEALTPFIWILLLLIMIELLLKLFVWRGIL